MEIKRANEIVNSLGVINVNYNGNPVWIENIHSENNQATVKDLNTEKELLVDISELKEG